MSKGKAEKTIAKSSYKNGGASELLKELWNASGDAGRAAAETTVGRIACKVGGRISARFNVMNLDSRHAIGQIKNWERKSSYARKAITREVVLSFNYHSFNPVDELC